MLGGAVPAGIVLLTAGVWLVRRAALRAGVQGPSMAPALVDGDRVLVNRLVYLLRRPLPGEVVLADVPEVPGGWVIKRIAHDASAPPQHLQDGSTAGRAVSSSRGRYFLVGDNPAWSTDSRRFGWVPRERIVGRVWYRYWPPSRRGTLV